MYMNRTKHITALRKVMDAHGMEAFIINGSDAHLSEYVPDRWQSRQWLPCHRLALATQKHTHLVD
jgi:Xaa-Pro aminopeptidase